MNIVAFLFVLDALAEILYSSHYLDALFVGCKTYMCVWHARKKKKKKKKNKHKCSTCLQKDYANKKEQT